MILKLKVIQPQPKYKTGNFPNLRKRLLRDNPNQKQIRISKCCLVRLSTINIVKFLVFFVFFPIQHRSYHNNIVPNKDINIFDKCAAECVHLCPQEEQWTSLWTDSKGDNRQIIFITLNRFCYPLSNPPLPNPCSQQTISR